jgi:threonine dehydratase
MADVVTPDDVEAAAHRIERYVRVTPVIAVEGGELGLAGPAWLKLELLQHAGSFKPRGAFHRVLRADVPQAGLLAASGGNHGAAVAHVAARLGHHAEVFVPSTSPTMKRDRIAGLGARVVVVDGYYDDAQRAADERQRETGALLVHPYEHPDVVAGQGTMGRELEAQVGPIDTLLVACGGGGFIAGQAAWFAGRVNVVAVEPETSQCLRAALAAGGPTPVAVSGVASDSLGAERIGSVAWEVVRRYVHNALTVADDAIRAAQRAIWDGLRLVAEPGGATALAALRTGAYVPAAGERVAVAVCGSNCDPATVTSAT